MDNKQAKEILSSITKDIDKAMAEIAKKYNLEKLKILNSTYNSNGFTTKVEGVFAGGISKDMQVLQANADIYGFKKEIANSIINYAGKQYTVVGLKRSNLMLKSQENNKTYSANIKTVYNELVVQKSTLINPSFVSFKV